MTVYEKAHSSGLYVVSRKRVVEPALPHYSKEQLLARMEEDDRKKRVHVPVIEFQRRRIRVGGETI